jgi:hypothetical protein
MLALAVPALLGGGAVAVAATSGRDAENVQASIVFTHVRGSDYFCTDATGRPFFEEHVIVDGVSSGDPRLSGDVEVHVTTFGLAEEAPGYQTGTIRVRDGDTGAWKAQGRFYMGQDGNIGAGAVVGEVRDPATASGLRSSLIGGLRLSFNDDGSITAQIGGEAPDNQIPATIASGHCGGAPSHFETDIPAPGGGGSAETLRSPARSRWSG